MFPVNSLKEGLVLEPVFWKKLMLPSLWPTNKSKSLSLSISTKVGVANPFTIMSLRGLSEFSKKIYFGLKLVPVFWKNLIVPSWHPIKRSLSASLSMSIKKGVENF